MITHVLDSSAVLAHYFQERGADAVNVLLADDKARVAITAASVVTLRSAFLRVVRTPDSADRVEADRAFCLYTKELLLTLDVTRAISEEAASLIWHAAPATLDPIDALIAATTKLHSATLVHCNSAFLNLPEKYVPQVVL